jgi:hypothetical protein
MNFHDRHGPILAEPDVAFRYRPVSPREHPAAPGTLPRLRALAAAPVLGSRLLFPPRFDDAARRLMEDAGAAEVAPDSAAWFFGSALHLEIDPARLRRRISDWVRDHRGPRWVGASFLDAAEWSAALQPISDSPVHREMRELVAAGADFRDTRGYRHLLYGIEVGRPARRNGLRLATADDVDAYFRYCRDLIKSMRKRGAVRHRVSGAFHRLRLKHRDVRPPKVDSAERDIGVAIGADGEIIRHLGGKHRTAIAQALGLPTLPVEIRMVHVNWLARQMHETGLAPHLALQQGLAALAGEQAAENGA